MRAAPPPPRDARQSCHVKRGIALRFVAIWPPHWVLEDITLRGRCELPGCAIDIYSAMWCEMLLSAALIFASAVWVHG
jgi:hypothetical protein